MILLSKLLRSESLGEIPPITKSLSFSDYHHPEIPYEVKPSPIIGNVQKEVFIHQEKTFWMDKNGKMHNARGDHALFASKILNKSVVDYENASFLYKEMNKNGWIRIIIYSSVLYFDYPYFNYPNSKQMSELKSYAIENDLDLYDETKRKKIELLESHNSIKSKSITNVELLKQKINEFYSYMKKRLKIKRDPKIVLVDNKENSKKLWGYTGNFNPEEWKITVYITGRHIIDILRTLSHELIHTMQHESGMLKNYEANTDTGYAQKNPIMRRCEADAYVRGSLYFRDWQDLHRIKMQKKKQ